ncbi:MAG: hypothetical protein JST82_15995 [Bacteroidetes bacterium]|nr:hypothetical protein [Bacteroidota bacterium]
MKKLILLCCVLLSCAAVKAQPYINFINNTSCTVWEDFYCRASCTGLVVNTGGALIPGSGTTTFDAYVLNGNTAMPTGAAWLYGRIGDDPNACSLIPPGSGCQRNMFLTISNGVCVPGVTSGCYNADMASTCNTCGNSQIFITTTYYANGDLDVTIN